MLTIFTIPKPFKGKIGIIQRNAIKSWTLLQPKCEIILFGSETGTKEVCAEFGLTNIENIKNNEFGTPFLDSAFKSAKEKSSDDFLCYVNCDIILTEELMSAILKVKEKFSSFLAISQRWNLDVKDSINFNDVNWMPKLKDDLIKNGSGPTGVDCFVWPRSLDFGFLPFLVGRQGWDNWFLYRAHILGIPSIDITESAMVVHQNHDYSHVSDQNKNRAEIENNLRLIGSVSHVFTQREVDWILSKQGFKKQKVIPFVNYCYRCIGSLPIFYPYFNLTLRIILFPVLLLTQCAIKIRRFILNKKLSQFKKVTL